MVRKAKYCVFHSLEGSGKQSRGNVVCGEDVQNVLDGGEEQNKKRKMVSKKL